MAKKGKSKKKSKKKRSYQNKKLKSGENLRYEEDYRPLLLVDDKPIYEIGDFIPVEKYKEMKEAYSNSKNQRLLADNKTPVKSHLFGKGGILKLIGQPDCHAIRIYYGDDEKGNPQLMLVGVYRDGKDMTEHSLVLDVSKPCPHFCPEG